MQQSMFENVESELGADEKNKKKWEFPEDPSKKLQDYSGELFEAHLEDLKARQGYILFPNKLKDRSELMWQRINSKSAVFEVI